MQIVTRTNLVEPANDTATKETPLEQFVVFQLDNELYAVPILAVTEVVPIMDITPVPNAPEYVIGLTNLRGKVLPVLDLIKKFNLKSDTPLAPQHIMIGESEQKTLFGIVVDQVTEVLKVPIDTIKPSPEVVTTKISAEYLGGVILLPDEQAGEAKERMVLILDLQKILSEDNIKELQTVQHDQVQATQESNKQEGEQ